jgi:FkbM family methyltransferase
MTAAVIEELAYQTLTVRGHSFHIYKHPVVAGAADGFASGSEEGTLRFFDAVLPRCSRMIDWGAYLGFTALYAAGHGVEVSAFEPSGVNFQYLSANVEVNPALAPHIGLYGHGIEAADTYAPLYARGHADSESSLFQIVERDRPIAGQGTGTIELRAAADVLRRANIDRRTLLKIDIEGAEYAVLPAIANILAERKPWLHVAFHPFNLAADREPYAASLHRLRAAMEVAEATASYRYMHLFAEGDWCSIGPEERPAFLRHYLLQPKTLPRIASPQYGFVGAVAFSDEPLPPGA